MSMFEVGGPMTFYIRCSKCHYAEKHVGVSCGWSNCPKCDSNVIDLSAGSGSKAPPSWWVEPK